MPQKNRLPDYVRVLERLVALAEAYGATDIDALARDVETLIRVEFLILDRRVRSSQERARRAVLRAGGPTAPLGPGC